MSSRASLFQPGKVLGIWVTAVVTLAGGLFGPPARAETLARQRIEAQELVSEALSHEIYARGPERQLLLARAVELWPDQPGAHWHLGEVRVGNRWLPVTGPIETGRQRQLRETYEQRRSSAPDTVDSHLTLAD
jgi:hypothetical protein